MSEFDLLELSRSASANQVAAFAQIITISFAMVVAIFYFLNQARPALKAFAFTAYSIGMLLYLGQLLIESNFKVSTLTALAALPSPSVVARQYVALNGSWLSLASSAVFNLSFWLLWLGNLYLLFFWRKTSARGPEAQGEGG
jgi:hypothetical protein